MDNLSAEKINSLAKDDLDELLANFCEKGKLEEVKYLLTSPEIIKKPSLKNTAYYPLSAAAKGGQIEVLRYLLTSKDTKNRINFHYSADYALVSASESGQFDVVKYLLTSPELK